MRVAIAVGGAPWDEAASYVREAEGMGVAVAWSAEAWGPDAVTPLAWLAAKTQRILLGAGVMQISARTPAMTAMTALTLAEVSGNRFLLGLGVSGPQVVEGLHGQPFAHPLGRMRETIEIVRRAMAGERIAYEGRHFRLPLPGGEGKALRLALRPNADIPIYLATLAPKMLELTGEVADGWLGTSFVPEASGPAFMEPIAAGAAKVRRSLDDIDLCQGGDVAFGDDVERLVAGRKGAARLLARRDGVAHHELLQRRLPPPGVRGRGRRVARRRRHDASGLPRRRDARGAARDARLGGRRGE